MSEPFHLKGKVAQMKANKQHQTRLDVADVAMLDVSASLAKPRVKRSMKSPFKASNLQPNTAEKVAKFKDEKHVSLATFFFTWDGFSIKLGPHGVVLT